MRPRLGFALSLLAALGIHAVILFVPRAALVENVHLPTVELELTEVAGPPALAARPAVVVTQPMGARASSRVDLHRQPEAQPPAPAPAAVQPGSQPAEAAPGGQSDAPAVDQPAADTQAGSDTQSASGNGGASTGLQSAETQGSRAVAVPTFIPPRPLSKIIAKYPFSARRSGFEGVVKVSALVDEKGAVTSAEVISSSGHVSMDNAALEAVRQTPFSAALQDGKSVAGRALVQYRFILAAKPD